MAGKEKVGPHWGPVRIPLNLRSSINSDWCAVPALCVAKLQTELPEGVLSLKQDTYTGRFQLAEPLILRNRLLGTNFQTISSTYERTTVCHYRGDFFWLKLASSEKFERVWI